MREQEYDTKETGRFIESIAHEKENKAQISNKPRSSYKLSYQGSPLRVRKGDPSRHQPLRDRQANPNISLRNQKNEDPDANALNRFHAVHKRSGDKKQDLERDQRYGAFPSNTEHQYRRTNEDLYIPSTEVMVKVGALKKQAIRNYDFDSSTSPVNQNGTSNTAMALYDNRAKP